MKTKLYALLALTMLVQVTFASQNRKVLVIGIDGCRSDALQQANTPNMDGLIANGLFTYDAWHLGITVSGPSWSTIMTGVWWNKHGVTSNSYTGSNFNDYPYFPKRAKEIKPNLNCVQVVEWPPLNQNVYNDGWDQKLQTPDHETSSTGSVASAKIVDSDLDCMFVYFDAVDGIGHSSGFDPNNPLYIQAIEDVDSKIGQILAALHSRPNYANEDWLILITTDHGGTGTGHGGNSYVERHIWWIASGPDVVHQQITAADPGTYNPYILGLFTESGVDTALLRQSPVQADIAVTALHHLIYDSGIDPETYPFWDLDGKSWLATFSDVKDIAENSITVYPNPTKGLVTFWMENKSNEDISVEVYDMNGRLVNSSCTQQSTNKVNINLAGQPAGEYIAKVHIGTSQLTKKIQLTN